MFKKENNERKKKKFAPKSGRGARQRRGLGHSKEGTTLSSYGLHFTHYQRSGREGLPEKKLEAEQTGYYCIMVMAVPQPYLPSPSFLGTYLT